MNSMPFAIRAHSATNPASCSSAPQGATGAFTDAFGVDRLTEAVGIATDKLTRMLDSDALEGVSLERPQDLLAEARALMTTQESDSFDAERFSDILDLYIRTGVKLNSRGYMARQFSSVAPVTAAFDLVSAMAPQPASFYEVGQLANVADKIIAEEFGRRIGWETGRFDMVSTSGASLANMTAVLVARNRRLADSWKAGVGDGAGGRPAIAMGEDAHFSVSRIGGIIGIGEDQIVRLPLDARRRICAKGAAAALDAAAARGLDVFCIVAAAGTTSVGANDPLEALAHLARERGAWLHVDAAHNGAFLLSDRLRGRLAGIELADSFCLDAHKTLFVPAMCTLLFYRERGLAATAFPQKASYVLDPQEDEMSRFESGTQNFECTKRPAILNLWLAWALFGRRFFEEKLDYLTELTDFAHDQLNDLCDFAVAHRPESNILCFTHRPPGVAAADLGRLQLELRNRIRADGRYFISKVDLDGETVLRIVLMNHRIGRADIAGLVEEIRQQAAAIIADWTRQGVAA
ncbi:pyridoxal-dependent decarboxylase [Sphingobium sufflavum]|uniref:pyridoxal phosphate-dependent decarboxylase family protein n=1 Tax=Sphingobium sufflavum TaxID=1129547 RepID=UPI001F26A679|nr:pyridoxal-dependent decarboxylase [Sphingobium sufflavum]MCE7796693.1 pyridoxal-dependent decarboxylase [Sphingobium sufflavum]